MMKYILVFLMLSIAWSGQAQMFEKIQDSLQRNIKNATSVAEKMEAYYNLGRTFNTPNPTLRTEAVEQLIFLGEGTRDKNMISRAYRYAANAYAAGNSSKESLKKAFDYAEKAYKLATEISEATKDKFSAIATFSRMHRLNGKSTEAIRYSNEAIAVAEESKDDSLRITGRVSLSLAQLEAKQKIESFKSLLVAQTLSEKLKEGKQKNDLLLSVYGAISGFFKDIGKLERAIDYQYKILDVHKTNKAELQKVVTLESIGYLMLAAKKKEAAKKTFEEMITLTKEKDLSTYSFRGTLGLVSCFLESDKPDEGLEYAQKHPEIVHAYAQYNMATEWDFALGYLYTAAGRYDSAKYYYEKSYYPLVAKTALSDLPSYHNHYGWFFFKTKNYLKAIELFKKSIAINDSLQKSTDNIETYKQLDSCYQELGDGKNSLIFANKYLETKQKLQELNSEKDVLNLEIDAENKRKEWVEKTEAEETQKRHNWQYMGILVVILMLFTMLASFGVFKVSTKLIRILGFVAFILLFEFIILIADTWIHHATHGEPWKVLGIKVVLIAILLPLHHFLEHKVVAYISQRQHAKKPL